MVLEEEVQVLGEGMPPAQRFKRGGERVEGPLKTKK
jgi:hypothetical protein